MAARREGWFDQTGLNVIRVIIGTYICAVSMGLASGFDPHVLFAVILPSNTAVMATTLVWFSLSFLFILGVALRPITLILVAFIVSSAITTFAMGAANLQDMWQTMAFAAAVLMCYASMKPYEMHRAVMLPTVVFRGGAARVMQRGVVPRRVKRSPRTSAKGRGDESVRRLRPVIAPTEQLMGRVDVPNGQALSRRGRQDDDLTDDDVINIFANH